MPLRKGLGPLFLINLLLLTAITNAAIRLPSILSSNMVLQQRSAVKLWGWASPAEKILITASWSGITDTVTATGDANWELIVSTPAAGGPYTIRLQGQNEIVLDNIMLGEVWICSGQSNMEWSSLHGLKEMDAEIPVSNNTNIRFFSIPKTTSDNPQDDCEGAWQLCNAENLRAFSAIGYFFGKKLQQSLNVPIGLINSSWGGTPAETWTPETIVTSDDNTKKAAAKIAASPWWPIMPGKTFNAMIAPATPFTIAGAIWYQGESNVNNYSTYQLLFTNMIYGWRQAWKKEFPFYFVQIAPFAYVNNNVGALLREAQANSMAYPKTGMVVITDLVENVKDIHPRQKHAVADRLANYALADNYKIPDIVYKSPVFKNMVVSKNTAHLYFDNAPNGFLLKGEHAMEWYVAGVDKIFYPATVKLEKKRLLVSSPQVKIPVAVRFGFSNEAIGNIFNKEGLPVTPFRTDSWEMDTAAK
jgi:sialate O-acetylesterase